jgi:zinc protease
MTTRSIVLAACVAASALAAQQTPPAAGTPKDFRLPPRTNFTLPNGMQVSMVHFGSVPKVYVRLSVLGGGISEKADEVWLARVTAEMLREGTTSRSAEQIARDAAGMGGSISSYAGPDRTTLYGEVLTERGPQFVALLADVAQHPLFAAADLERIKATELRNLAIEKSQPQGIAQERYAALQYPGHPYGRTYPTDTMLRGYTPEKVRAFYDANYGATRAHMYVAGVFDDAAMERAIRSAFSGWAAGAPPASIDAPPPPATRTVALIDRPNAVQSTIFLGLRVPGPADSVYIPLVVTNALLGGSFGSRITNNIREDKGYTYSPYSYVDDNQRGSTWQEVADVTTPVTGASLTEIFKEIDRLQHEPPATAELRGIQNYLAGVFIIQNSSRQGVGDQLAHIDLFGLGDDWLRSYVRRVVAVTPAQVSQTAATLLQPGRMQLVVVGDKKVVQEQLAPWGTIVP